MLFKLAMGNIRRSFRNYWAYFLSSAFSVFVLYLFMSIVYGKTTAEATTFQSTSVVFGIGAFLTALFTAFFIWYSNTFFIKSRKKEFATYMLLGMSKAQTIRLSFFESTAILAMAYALGLAAGILLTKLMIMLLFSIMQVQMPVPFEINLRALKMCSGVYGGVFLLITIHSVILLSRNSLIELINASKKSESGMKVSGLTYLIGLLAILCLGLGYYLSVVHGMNIILWIPIVFLVCIGTAFLFLGLATLYFHFNRKNETSLYRGTKLITVSQLMHRYRGNVGALTIIAITTSVALCAVLTCCGLFSKIEDNAKMMNPFSVEYKSSAEADQTFNDTLKDYPVTVRSREEIHLLDAKAGGIDKNDDVSVYLISESNYNEILTAQGRTDLAQFSGDNGCVLVQYNGVGLSTKTKIDELNVKAGGVTLPMTVEENSKDTYISLDRFRLTLVVKDSVYETFRSEAGVIEYHVTGYELDNDMATGGFITDLNSRMNPDSKMKSYYMTYLDSMKLMGVLMYVGVFIGLIFIAATGSILYFRMAMEAAEDREKFVMLFKIGLSDKELRSAVAKELAIVFGAPFIVAAVNAFAASYPLELLVHLEMKDIFFVILLVYAILYGLYFLITLNKYMKILKSGI